MTDNQRKFANEYIKDGNATRAYKAAYPHVKNDKTAQAAGSRMLSNVIVKTYIDEHLQKISDEKVADAKEVIETVTAILRRELEDEVPTVVGTGNGYSEVINVTKKPSIKDVMSAASLLARIFGMEKTNLNVEGGLPVVISGSDSLAD